MDAEVNQRIGQRLAQVLGRQFAGPAQADDAWNGVVRLARALVPREWRTTLDETAGAVRREASAGAGEPRPFLSYCQSCSGSLREYPGPSPRYCRFCSDGEGRLLPRDEVQQLIAEWMTTRQEGLSEAEARERAARYMSAMPAWS